MINNEVKKINEKTNIIAVTKKFNLDQVSPLIKYGHIHYGENKVQEAVDKWSNIKKNNNFLKLHLIGKLQTNKVKYVIPLFDYIHSLDSEKLAEKISFEQKKIKKSLKIFIQINIGNETQKSGIDSNNLKNFYDKCINHHKLNIIGLMCIPPRDLDVKLYFNKMAALNKSLNLKELSMGMSSDYLYATECGASFVRIGTKIFGQRT